MREEMLAALLVLIALTAAACGGSSGDEGGASPNTDDASEASTTDDGDNSDGELSVGGRCTSIVEDNIREPADGLTGQEMLDQQFLMLDILAAVTGCPDAVFDLVDERLCAFWVGSSADADDGAAQAILKTQQDDCLGVNETTTTTTTTTTTLSAEEVADGCEAAAESYSDLFLEASSDDFSFDEADLDGIAGELANLDDTLEAIGCTDRQIAICGAWETLVVNGVIPAASILDDC